MSISTKIQALITAANTVTGESRTDLTSAVQDLKDGYGGSTVTKGLVFSDYDSDGYPTKAEFVGEWTSIPNNYCYRVFADGIGKKIHFIKIPEGVTSLAIGAFRDCNQLTDWELPTTLVSIGDYGCSTIAIQGV